MATKIEATENVLELLDSAIRKRLPKQRRVYTSQLLARLMVLEFLERQQSLQRQRAELMRPASKKFQGSCKWARKGSLSPSTSATCQARQQMPFEEMQVVFREIFDALSPKSLLGAARFGKRDSASAWDAQYHQAF